jgi:hypothetical protein
MPQNEPDKKEQPVKRWVTWAGVEEAARQRRLKVLEEHLQRQLKEEEAKKKGLKPKD